MNNNYTLLTRFKFSTEAHVVKSKLDSEGIKTLLMDEKTIDSDPLISQAIGGVKLLIFNDDLEKAVKIYTKIRVYQKDKNGNDLHCPSCHSTQILIAPLKRKNFFFMLFPFFERSKYICNACNLVLKSLLSG